MRLLHECVNWQETYKLIDYTHRILRDDNFGGKARPWGRDQGRTRVKDSKAPNKVLGTSKFAYSGPWSMRFCRKI